MEQFDYRPSALQTLVEKSCPPDYKVEVFRSGRSQSYSVRIMRDEQLVCRTAVHGPDIRTWVQDFMGVNPTLDQPWIVEMLQRLADDLEALNGVNIAELESGITVIESDKPLTPVRVHTLLGRATFAPSRPSPSWWRRNWLDVIEPRRKPFIDPRRRGYW